jgi:hypothetical protein
MCYGDKLLSTITPPTRRAHAQFEWLGLWAR